MSAYRLLDPDAPPLDASLPDTPQVPEAAALSLPNGAATTDERPALGRDRPAASSPPPTGLMPDELGLSTVKTARTLLQAAETAQGDIPTWRKVLAVVSDIAMGASGGKPFAGAALRQEQVDKRKAAVEQEKLGIERGKFALDVNREQRAVLNDALQQQGKMMEEAGKLADRFATMSDEDRIATANAFEAQARQLGGPNAATIVRGILAKPEVGKFLGPLARYLDPGMAPAMAQTTALLMRTGKVDDALKQAQTATLSNVGASLYQRVDSISASLKAQYGDKPIPISVLEAAIQASNPTDAPGASPELQLLRGVGDVYGNASVKDNVAHRLNARGFEVPAIQAKAAEAGAVTKASKQAEKDVNLDPGNLAREIAAGVAKIQAEAPVKIAEAVNQARAMIPVKVAEKTALSKVDEGASPKISASDMSTFTGQYEAVSKSFRDVRDAYGRILAAKPPKDEKLKGPADIALMVGFMKIIDPTTGVREGEYATAANAGGVSQSILNAYNKLVDGGKLTDDLRTSFRVQATQLFNAHRDAQLGLETEYKRMATERNMKPETVVPDLLGKYRSGTPGKGGEDLSRLSDEEIRRRLKGPPRG